jgi:glycosyltransferase involved in cell wall biosynthesis
MREVSKRRGDRRVTLIEHPALIDTFAITRDEAEVAVLMPVHNEADIIEKVALEFYKTISHKMPVEIVLSEDGSTDGTREVIAHLAKRVPLKATLSPTRKGYAGGIRDGLNLVSAKHVLITDSDGQLGATDFWKLWDLREKWDIVSGWRINRADSLSRKIMSDVFQRMNRSLLRLPKLHDVTSPYKLMKTEVANLVAHRFRYMDESFWTEFTVRALQRGYSITEIPVNHTIRHNGSTRVYKLSKIPGIATRQFTGLLRLWREIGELT